MLGVLYTYVPDSTIQIRNELERIKETGLQIVCVPFEWNSDPKNYKRIRTTALFTIAKNLGLKTYVRYPPNLEDLKAYLSQYAQYIDYFQVLNEADAHLLHEWNTPSQLPTLAEKYTLEIKKANSKIKTVATFISPLIPPLVTAIAQHVDIIGYDVYEDIQLYTFNPTINALRALSGKTIWITELGKPTLHDQTQANFIIKVLDLAKQNLIEACIIWCWKHDHTGLNIKDRQTEQAIKQWLTQ